MDEMKSIWMNGRLVPWRDANVHVLTHTLHYGAGAFEGIRVYKTEKGPAVFRLAEHIDRLFYSAAALKMEIPFTRKQIIEGVLETLRANELEQGYIRPLVYLGYGVMGLNPRNAPVDVAIACWKWGAYLPHESIDVKISSFIRIHPQTTVADAKINGHYVNSIMAVLELRGTKYHEALFLDYEGNLAEGPGENLFLIRNGEIFTPQRGNILNGITRDTVIRIASDLGYKVTETVLSPSDAFGADEAFFTGTAAEVTPIQSIDDHVLGKGGVGPVSRKVKDAYLDVVYGRNERYVEYLTFV